MSGPAFLESIEVERRRRLDGRFTPDPHADALWSRAMARLAPTDAERLAAARGYALGIEYRHEGLASAIYAAHPLRVAAMALLAAEEPTGEIGVVGLLHNVLEVSAVPAEELDRRFGADVLAQLRALTVDRALQWDAAYKRAYYAAIAEGPIAARVVKVWDKMDNLYTLGLNPDADVRRRYLAEIREHVLPMAERDVPALAPRMAELIEDTERTGRLEPVVELASGGRGGA